jgi:hypothetical protein
MRVPGAASPLAQAIGRRFRNFSTVDNKVSEDAHNRCTNTVASFWTVSSIGTPFSSANPQTVAAAVAAAGPPSANAISPQVKPACAARRISETTSCSGRGLLGSEPRRPRNPRRRSRASDAAAAPGAAA